MINPHYSMPALHVKLGEDRRLIKNSPTRAHHTIQRLDRDTDPSYQNPDLVDLDNDLAESAGTPGLSKLALSMNDKNGYFDHRACLWFAAKYKRVWVLHRIHSRSAWKEDARYASQG